MVENKGKDPKDAARGSDPDALLKELNLEEMEGLEEVEFTPGRPLPKKVELDVEDIGFEEEEEEEKPPTREVEAEPAEKPGISPPPQEKPGRTSNRKLMLLIAAVLAPLIAAAVLFLYLGLGAGLKKTTLLPTQQIELLPFVLNYPAQDNRTIIKVKVRIIFNNSTAPKEFLQNDMHFRDLIFRFLQGQGPDPLLAGPKSRDILASDLIRLLNGSLKQGRITSLLFLEATAV
ncbi:MAG: flagellar basal body-associated FliL family protein [Pseudomonadota bacterium]